MDLPDHAESYLLKRQRYDEAKKVSSRLEAEWRQTERDFVDAMLDKKVSSFKMASSGMSFTLSEHLGVSVTQKNDGEIRSWLVATEGDDAPFLMEMCSKPAVTEHVKKIVKSNRLGGQPDDAEVPEFLKVKTRPVLSCRGYNA